MFHGGFGHGFQPLSLDDSTRGEMFWRGTIFGWPKKDLANSEAQLWVVEQVSLYAQPCDFEDFLGFL